MNTYLDAARAGRNDWWRYLIGYPFILIMWLVAGSIPIVVLSVIVTMDNDPLSNVTPTGFVGVAPWLNFVTLMSSFLPFLLATSLAVVVLHRRSLRTLVTPAPRVDWKRMLWGLVAWMVLSGALAFAEAVLYPGRYVFSLDLQAYLPVALASLLLVPLQTTAEEFFFRGYLLQHAGLKIKNIFLLSLISGLLFTLPHLPNPEVAEGGAWMLFTYFSIGAFLAFVTLRDNGLELALGIHAGNNLVSALFASYTNDVMPTPVLFTVTEMDMTYNIITLFLGMLAFYLLMFKVWPRKAGPLEGMPPPSL